MKIFFDTEFSHLSRSADLLSIACVNEVGERFYAERTDYDEKKLTPFVIENVIPNLLFKGEPNVNAVLATPSFENNTYKVKGDREFIRVHLDAWLKKFPNIEMWGDGVVYDWIMFSEEIFGMSLPQHVFYLPFDIVTLFSIAGVDPDVKRTDFAEMSPDSTTHQHNALYDADVLRVCHDKLIQFFPKK